jgi:NAD(P)-dependent dehydrogenase (short-subunit alcohol dehydrogenase family)
MAAQTIIITGASDGIGAAAARALVASGESVVLVGRTAAKTEALASELGVPYHLADYSSLAQVRRLAAELDAAYPRIDVLANNAGGIMAERTVTEDGHELTFQVNHLSGFLLTTLLMDKLLASSATVIQTSSIAARLMSKFELDNLELAHGYSAQGAYGAGKLANILFTRELHRRYSERGLSAAAFHPGVVGSNFGHSGSGFMRWLYANPVARKSMLTSEQGADQLVWLAQSVAGVDWQSGEYYEKRRVARSSPKADDAELARRFWEISEQIVAG